MVIVARITWTPYYFLWKQWKALTDFQQECRFQHLSKRRTTCVWDWWPVMMAWISYFLCECRGSSILLSHSFFLSGLWLVMYVCAVVSVCWAMASCMTYAPDYLPATACVLRGVQCLPAPSPLTGWQRGKEQLRVNRCWLWSLHMLAADPTSCISCTSWTDGTNWQNRVHSHCAQSSWDAIWSPKTEVFLLGLAFSSHKLSILTCWTEAHDEYCMHPPSFSCLAAFAVG